MVITMAVLVAAVALLLLFVPQPRGITQPGVDPVAAASEAAASLGFEPSAVAPEDLGDGWVASYARTEEQEGVVQWRLGYLSPDERRVDVEQAVDVTARWLTRDAGPVGESAATGDPLGELAATGQEVSLAGGTWVLVPRADGDRTFARRDGDVVTVLSTASEAGLAPLEEVARALDLG